MAMNTKEVKRLDLTGQCPKCGSDIVLHTQVNNDVGIVSDGDDATCENSVCNAFGILIGAPSDGICVDWEFYDEEMEGIQESDIPY